MSEIQWPVFLREKGDTEICRYCSFSELQGHLEKIDVENEEYEAWDVRGQPLRLSVQVPTWLKLEITKQAKASSLQAAIAELASDLDCEADIDASLPYDQQIALLLENMELAYRSQRWWTRLFRRF